MRQAQAKRQQNISFRRLRHKTKKSCDPVLTTDSKRRLPAPLSELLHKMKSTQLFKDNISESWENSSCSATKNKPAVYLRCPLRIAAIPARRHPSSLPFSAACSSSAPSSHQPSITKLDFPDRIGLSRQNRPLLAGSVFFANPPSGKPVSITTSTHKTPSGKIPSNKSHRVSLKTTMRICICLFRSFRCLGFFRCFDVSIILNIFFPVKRSPLSQAERTYKTDAL